MRAIKDPWSWQMILIVSRCKVSRIWHETDQTCHLNEERLPTIAYQKRDVRTVRQIGPINLADTMSAYGGASRRL